MISQLAIKDLRSKTFNKGNLQIVKAVDRDAWELVEYIENQVFFRLEFIRAVDEEIKDRVRSRRWRW